MHVCVGLLWVLIPGAVIVIVYLVPFRLSQKSHLLFTMNCVTFEYMVWVISGYVKVWNKSRALVVP